MMAWANTLAAIFTRQADGIDADVTGRSDSGIDTSRLSPPPDECREGSLRCHRLEPVGLDNSAAHRKNSGSGVRGGRKQAPVGGLVKRMFDVVVATLVFVLLAPILVVTGVLIRLLLGSPIIVVERSVGLGGEVFGLLSFRTEPKSATLVSEWTKAITTALRESGIDKLPHLYNVVRGDMSLVGPELVDAQHALHSGIEGPELLLARPGVVSVRRHSRHILRPSTGEIGPERLYILRWSLWLDLRILCGAFARIHVTDANSPTK